MSMIACQLCSRYIDSDDDPDCFVEEDGRELVMCASCRDHAEWLQAIYEKEESQ